MLTKKSQKSLQILEDSGRASGDIEQVIVINFLKIW